MTAPNPEGDVREALDLALAVLIKFEPGDSRAVSDAYVAMASAGTPHHNDEARRIIREELARQEAAPAALQPSPAAPSGCTLPPDGWFCTRQPGHDGPCAAWPETGAVAAIVSAHVYVRDGQTIVDSGAAAAEIEALYARQQAAPGEKS